MFFFRACADVSILPPSDPVEKSQSLVMDKDDIENRHYFSSTVIDSESSLLVSHKQSKTRATLEPSDEIYTLATEQTLTNDQVQTLTNVQLTTPGFRDTSVDDIAWPLHVVEAATEADNIVYKITRQRTPPTIEDTLEGEHSHVTAKAAHIRNEEDLVTAETSSVNASNNISKLRPQMALGSTITEPSISSYLTGEDSYNIKTTYNPPTISSAEDSFDSENNSVNTLGPVTPTTSTTTIGTQATTAADVSSSTAYTTAMADTSPELGNNNNSSSLVEEFYQRELLLLQLMRQSSQQQQPGSAMVGLAGWLAARPPPPPPTAVIGEEGGAATLPIGWGILLSLPITVLFFLVLFLLHRRLQKKRNHQQPLQRRKKRLPPSGDRPEDGEGNKDDRGDDDDDDEDDLYEYPSTVLSHGGSAPALYHSLSRNMDRDGITNVVGQPPSTAAASSQQRSNKEPITTTYVASFNQAEQGPTATYSHTYASVPDVVSTSLFAGNNNASSIPSLSNDDNGQDVGGSVDEVSELGSTGEMTPKTGFVRHMRGRYSLVGSSRRWKSEDWDSEENLFSTLALKLRRKQSRPEITEL